MKKINRMIKTLLALVLSIGIIGVSPSFAAEEPTGKITAENYEENREAMEKELNGDNLISSTMSKDYAFGTYGRVHIDGWNVSIIDLSIDKNGMHTINFEADDGYKLAKGTKKNHFVTASADSTERDKKVVINADGTGTLTFTPTAAYNPTTLEETYNKGPVLVRLAAFPDNANYAETTYNSNFIFTEVSHTGITLEGKIPNFNYQLNGSRTYWVKKSTEYKVYYVSQSNFKPIETYPLKTGVSNQHDDYSNRYIIIPGHRTNSTGTKLSYDSTMFNTYIKSAKTGKFELRNSYEFYNKDNQVSMPDALDQEIVKEKEKVVGYYVQLQQFEKTVAYKYSWVDLGTVGLDYVYETKASDYNVQWTATGNDNGGTESSYSSLRHRASNVYITPIYNNYYTVKFFDHNGQISSEDVLKGADATAPADPIRDGYTFEGWDIDYTNVQSDLEVHAIFKEIIIEEPEAEKVTVNFVDYDGTLLKADIINKGSNATAPTVVQRDGYRFIGWDKAFDNVQADLTVTALYEAIVVPVPPVTPTTPPVTPTTPPTTPVVFAPVEETPNVDVPATEETVPEVETPKADPAETVKEKETPLAKGLGGSWALINLICVALTILAGLVLLLSKRNKEEEQDEENAEENENTNTFKRRVWTKVLAVIVAIVSVVVFILTEDITLPMQMTDKYTIVMVIIVLVQLVVMLVGRKWKTDDNEETQNAEA